MGSGCDFVIALIAGNIREVLLRAGGAPLIGSSRLNGEGFVAERAGLVGVTFLKPHAGDAVEDRSGLQRRPVSPDCHALRVEFASA